MIKIKPGELVEHYRIVEKFEHKGMGDVFLADDLALSRLVVLKFHKSNETDRDSALLKRFSKEAAIVASLNDSRIINIFSFGTFNGYSYMVMEYFDSESISEILKEGPIELNRAIRICIEVLKGLVAVHKKGILHRDIKASNILVGDENNVKIIDFGISKRLIEEDLKLTKTDHLIGTLQYMAPELLSGGKPSPASDLYSVGILLYEMLTGKNPYSGLNKFTAMERIRNRPLSLPQIPKVEIPPKLFSVFQKMVHQDSKRRYSDLTVAIKDLSTLNTVKTPDFENLLTQETDRLSIKKSDRKKSLTELWDEIDTIGPITVPSIEEIKTQHRPNLLFIFFAFIFVLFNGKIIEIVGFDVSDLRFFTSSIRFHLKKNTEDMSSDGDRSPSSVKPFKPSPILERGNLIEYEVVQKSGRSGKTLKTFNSAENIKDRRADDFLVSSRYDNKVENRVVSKNPFFPIKKVDPKYGYNIQLDKPESFEEFFPLEVGKTGHYSYFKLNKNGSFEEHNAFCQVYGKAEQKFLGRKIPIFKVACETKAPSYKEKAMYFYSPDYKHNIRDEVAIETNGQSIIEIRQIRSLSNSK